MICGTLSLTSGNVNKGVARMTGSTVRGAELRSTNLTVGDGMADVLGMFACRNIAKTESSWIGQLQAGVPGVEGAELSTLVEEELSTRSGF